jgi:aminoglycoside 3-N-acetyltransferase
MNPEPVVTRHQVIEGARNLGIAGQPICIHVSLRSFPKLEDGAATLIDGLLETGATLLVATMANQAFASAR